MSRKKGNKGKPVEYGRKGPRGSSQTEAKGKSPWPSSPPTESGRKKQDADKAASPWAKASERKSGAAGKVKDNSPWTASTAADRKRKFRDDSHDRSVRKHRSLSGGDRIWTGVVSAHPDGYGFVDVEGRSEDVFLSIDEMRDVMHGDTVEVRTIQRRGREAGILVRIVKEAPSEITAQFKIENGLGFAYPRSKRMQQAILIKRDDALTAHHDDWVRVEIQRGTNPLRGRIVEVLGDNLTPAKLVDLIVAEQGLSASFPPDVLRESEAIPERIRVRDKKDRLDLTHLPFVTIDGADARDFDDAICVSSRGDGFEAWVAIADVAHYVHEGSALDVEALSRGNSFYFPDRVIPMLPEKLSNGLCSLNPHVPRLAMVVRMRYDAGGKLRSTRMYNAIIHSQARLTYEQAAAWLEGRDATAVAEPVVQEMLDAALGLFKMLERGRTKRGALELELPEVGAVIDGDAVAAIKVRERNVAHKLIEEMMLAANTSVSMFMESKKAVQLFRVHPAPEREAIDKLNAFLGAFGLKIRHKAGEEVQPKDVQQALHASEDKPFAPVLHRLVLRSMQQAKYTTENVGHFGLAFDCYGHFTSPIRRYADLTTHRRLKALIDGSKPGRQDLEAVGAHVSTQERKQQRAEWDTQAMLAALYHKKDIGTIMGATVSGVSNRRVFLALKDTFAEASLNVDDLGQILELDEVHHRLTAKRGHFSIGLGDSVQVEIISTDPVRGQINVMLVARAETEATR